MREGKRDIVDVNIKYEEQKTGRLRGGVSVNTNEKEKKEEEKRAPSRCIPASLSLCLSHLFFINKTLLIRKSNRSQREGGQVFRTTTGIVLYFSLSASLDPA